MNKLNTMLNLFYYLLPKVLREQYHDSAQFYKVFLKRNFQKITGVSDDLSVKLIDDISKLGCPIETLYEQTDRTSYTSGPKLYIDNSYLRKPLSGSVPDISLFLLEDVNIIGTTDALIYKDKMYHNELIKMKDFHDLKRFDIFINLLQDKSQYKLTVFEDHVQSDNNTIYISLLKEHSSNYYHFVTEALPRLIITLHELKKQKDYTPKNHTLLIDYNVPAQCIEIVNKLTHNEMMIQYVKHGHMVHCQKLIYCTPLWLSLDNTTSLPNPLEEFFVDQQALEIVHKEINKSFKQDKSIKPYRKVYLQRLNNKLRPIINIIEVEKLLYKYDFEFIDTSHMSFVEQYTLFSETSVAIGASGASYTNLLFMQESSTAISLYPSTQSTNYYIFQPLAEVSKVNLIHFLTDPVDDSVSLHAAASVDINNLEKLLKDIS